MKSNKTKDKFIELRAQGMSFNKIAEDIKVSKVTLMKWEKELDREIAEVRFIELETLREKYYMNKQSRLECYGELLEKAKYELKGRDFSEISIDKLITIMNDLENKFNGELKEIKCVSEEKKPFEIEMIGEIPIHSWSLNED